MALQDLARQRLFGISPRVACPVSDTDDFYWLPTDPPFQHKRTVAERLVLLEPALAEQQNRVIAGSLASWGPTIVPRFTQIIFLTLARALRLTPDSSRRDGQQDQHSSNTTSADAWTMHIQRSGTCGNSPKNSLLEELAVALFSADVARIAALTTDGVTWRSLGQPLAEGQAAVLAAAKRERANAASTLVIQHVVSHGRAGAVTVLLTRPHQPASDFCLFFTFANAKGNAVDTITSYRAD